MVSVTFKCTLQVEGQATEMVITVNGATIKEAKKHLERLVAEQDWKLISSKPSEIKES